MEWIPADKASEVKRLWRCVDGFGYLLGLPAISNEPAAPKGFASFREPCADHLDLFILRAGSAETTSSDVSIFDSIGTFEGTNSARFEYKWDAYSRKQVGRTSR